MIKKAFILNFCLLLFPIIAQTQIDSYNHEDILVDPIFYPCWNIEPDSSIRPLVLNSLYHGKVIIETIVDTTTYKLNFVIVLFAKLKSIENTNDSIEIRLDLKIGNTGYLEEIKPKIIDHISHIKLKPSGIVDCDKRQIIFNLPIKIE